jgi:hypothetical protein
MGPVQVVNPVSGIYPDSVFLGNYGPDTLNIRWAARDMCLTGISDLCFCEVTLIIRDTN